MKIIISSLSIRSVASKGKNWLGWARQAKELNLPIPSPPESIPAIVKGERDAGTSAQIAEEKIIIKNVGGIEQGFCMS